MVELLRPRTLVYVGGNLGIGLCNRLQETPFDRVFVFEPVPPLAANLRRIFAEYPQVTVVEAACADADGECDFHLTDNHCASASMGILKEDFPASIQHVDTIRVRTVHLGDFLKAQGVDYIDEYLSDAQGMDLTIARTLEAYLSENKIGRLQMETAKDRVSNLYEGVPPNHESAFRDFLTPLGYQLIATGWDVLTPHVFDGVPDDWWEFDAMWEPVAGSDSKIVAAHA